MTNRLKRITMFTGNLGSGKTEIAINLALKLMGSGKKTALVDLDIINPYFRTRLVIKKLEDMGLKVIAPGGNLVFADLPALSPAVKGVIENTDIHGVFDIGGDDVGAAALGRYRDMLLENDFLMLFVVNTCRPFTRNPEGIIKYLNSIQSASGLKVGGLVSNANIGGETVLDTVLDGFETVSGTAGMLGLPVYFVTVKKDLEDKARAALKGRAEVVGIERFMTPPW
ncbi:MAG: hypothetical protein ACOY30_09235 [Bacillota bacterium]